MLKRGPINRIYGFKGLNTMKSLKMKMSVGFYVSVLYNSMIHHWLTKSTIQLIPVKYITVNLKETGRKEVCGVKMVCKSAESC